MKWNHTAMIFVISVNMAIYMLSMAGVPFVSGFNVTIAPSDLQEDFNSSGTMESWAGQTVEMFFGYIYATVQFLVNSLGTLILGLPYFLFNLGTPIWIYAPIGGVWAFCWYMWFMELISGRQLSG